MKMRSLLASIPNQVLSILTVSAAVVIIAGCSTEDKSPTLAVLQEIAAVEPTPTLIPGLPTSTPTPLVVGSIPDATQESEIPSRVATVQPTATPSPTITPVPSETPRPEMRLERGWQHLDNANYSEAVREFREVMLSEDIDNEQQPAILLAIGKAALADGQNEVAADALSQLIAGGASSAGSAESQLESELSSDDLLVADAYFLLAQIYEERGQCRAAVRAYESYLDVHADMQAYVQPRIADCYLVLGDQPAAKEALELAALGAAYPALKTESVERIAQLNMEEGEYQKAIDQYDSLASLTSDPKILGRAAYQAGWAEILTGKSAAGYARYLQAVEQYPQAFESYLALVDLIEAGYTVDDYQRGLVNYHAGSYEPAVLALERYIESNPLEIRDARLYLAWSLEQLGDIDAALFQLDAYIDENAGTGESQGDAESEEAAQGWIERAKLLARSGSFEDAVASYITYIELFPEGDQAPFAAWWAAALTEQLGQSAGAAELYEALANDYSEHQDAAEALFRAGLINWRDSMPDEAYRLWSRAATEYPEQQFGAASLVWLIKTLPETDIEAHEIRASELTGDTYYHLRARHIISDMIPFQATEDFNLNPSLIEQFAAETWLREAIGQEPGTDLGSVSPLSLSDGRLIRGEKLWRLGLFQEAKQELESLRLDYSEDPIASYQLAIEFRDIGLYRSSILAASSVLRNLETDVFSAPTYLGKLIYPTYFADLVVEEAERYGFDPLLQFALIRQESLFESFAQSHAAARGLSQVIPDTGEYIAQRLEWPDYVLEDLYKPYVGIAFGAYYLDLQLDSFDDDVPVALSAYNGGPGNASRWSAGEVKSIGEYLEIVDFGETREYIKRIYAGYAIYQFLYGK
jgi:soluble lytic murein transglycosylase